jgi:DNA-binding response OmpR family regulator
MRKAIKILVIEDDPSLSELLSDIFENEGYLFEVYEDTADIFGLVEEFKPDLVLLDYLLPSTNGGEICTQLKTNNETCQIPVIIYSAISKQMLPIQEFHCDSFVAKPFDLDVLLREIERYSMPEHAA